MIRPHPFFRRLLVAFLSAVFLLAELPLPVRAAPEISISQTPLTLIVPTHPEVLLAVTNSQSMDGDLGGAIMTGSGTVSALTGSSSPVDYDVPNGFTPPCTGPTTTGTAPYTVPGSGGSSSLCNQTGTLYDNSASRLNVLKAALTDVIQNYAADFDMGLMDYDTQYVSINTTWVYYMSPPNGFQFATSPGPTGNWKPNPCYQSQLNSCQQIRQTFQQLGVSGSYSDPWMEVAISSDNPSVNDVLYIPSIYVYPSVMLDYGGPNPPSPYPPNYTLLNYNQGGNQGVLISYGQYTPFNAVFETGPTNAGYVPHSNQVMYAERGFGYYTSDVANQGNLLLPITSYENATGCPHNVTTLQCYIQSFQPYLAPETNNPSSPEIKALAVQSPVAGLLRGAYRYFTRGYDGYNPPVSNTNCPAKKYVILLTDGLPTQDMGQGNWPPLGSRSAVGYGVYATFNLVGGGTVSTSSPDFDQDVLDGLTTSLVPSETNDLAVIQAVQNLQKLTQAGIKTYIVGMGAGVDPQLNPAAAATLKAMAIAGGTADYFPGTTPEAVTNDLSIIFSKIQVNNVTTTSAAVNSTSLNTGTVVYQAKFDSDALPYGDWTGDLDVYPVSAQGQVSTQNPVWDAASILDQTLAGQGWANRAVATWNPAANDGAGGGVPFAWENLSPTQQSELETYWDTLSSEQQSQFNDNVADYGQAVLDYLLGDTQDAEPAGPFRDRSALLGDIVYSNPLYVGVPQGTYTNPSYLTFKQELADRTPVVYVGANDGMLHAFDASPTGGGRELFAFVPNGVFANLANLTLPTYNDNHLFYVDGSPSAADVQFSDGSWHTILVGGLNAGGQSIYALDITHPSALETASGLASHVLWEFTSPYLGDTFSQPQIARIDLNGTTTFVVIFGSGYNNSDGNPYLFVVNAETGQLIDMISLCSDVPSACNTSEPNGLSTPVVVSDVDDGTGVDDLVYAGDLQGNLWRIDLSSPTPADWTASVLFQTQADQPITTAPVVTFGPPGTPPGSLLVMFGTGQFLGTPDLTTTDTQSFYGILDTTAPDATPPSRPIGLNKLQEQTITNATYTYTNSQGQTVSFPVRTITSNTIDWQSQDGWYMDLPDTGERVITNPRIEGGTVVFTTYTPSETDGDACSSGGYSYLMAVNYATGGAFPGPALSLNGQDTLTSADQVDGENPVGVGLGNGYAAAPTIISTRPGEITDIKLVTLSNDTISSWLEHSGNVGRLTWWEIR
jgi:type IV pilus assembly protein PilY1